MCCVFAGASLGVCPSPSLIQTNRIFFCVNVVDSLRCGEHYTVRQHDMRSYLWEVGAHRLHSALCVAASLVGCRGCRGGLGHLGRLASLVLRAEAPILLCRPRSYRSGSWAQLEVVSNVNLLVDPSTDLRRRWSGEGDREGDRSCLPIVALCCYECCFLVPGEHG